MKGLDYLILAIVALAVGFAIYKSIKKKPGGGCCGDCAHCATRTPDCKPEPKDD
ncbi:MAG: FeoB-associated Cys-rich membrane protein [Eubacteriales bacterium]